MRSAAISPAAGCLAAAVGRLVGEVGRGLPQASPAAVIRYRTFAGAGSLPSRHYHRCFPQSAVQTYQVPFTSGFPSSVQRRTMAFTTEQRGSQYGDDYRLFFKNAEGQIVSPFHDIPLKSTGGDDVYNMVVEVPRWSNAKMEICLTEKMNPIKQDVKKGKLRFVANCFPHHGYIWNYGALPQTWEDPDHVDPDTGCKGDGDPVDVCEIGTKIHPRGAVVRVKILGALALIDEGETDWKLLAIDVDDPMAQQLNDVTDIEERMPGLLAATVEWFKVYKIPDGKPANQFAFDGQAKGAEYAKGVVKGLAEQWANLTSSAEPVGKIDVSNTTLEKHRLSAEDAKAAVEACAAPGCDRALEDAVDKWHYVKV